MESLNLAGDLAENLTAPATKAALIMTRLKDYKQVADIDKDGKISLYEHIYTLTKYPKYIVAIIGLIVSVYTIIQTVYWFVAEKEINWIILTAAACLVICAAVVYLSVRVVSNANITQTKLINTDWDQRLAAKELYIMKLESALDWAKDELVAWKGKAGLQEYIIEVNKTNHPTDPVPNLALPTISNLKLYGENELPELIKKFISEELKKTES